MQSSQDCSFRVIQNFDEMQELVKAFTGNFPSSISRPVVPTMEIINHLAYNQDLGVSVCLAHSPIDKMVLWSW
jgi:hypothetical protein